MSTKTVPRTRNIDVIVTDDDHDDQMLVSLAAESGSAHLNLTYVDSGLELMELLRRRLDCLDLPDVIVLDLRMPLMDGHAVLEQLQKDDVLWQIPVVVFSTSADQYDKDLSLFRGAVSYRTKPSRYPDLVEFVTQLPNFASNSEYDYLDDLSMTLDREWVEWQVSEMASKHLR